MHSLPIQPAICYVLNVLFPILARSAFSNGSFSKPLLTWSTIAAATSLIPILPAIKPANTPTTDMSSPGELGMTRPGFAAAASQPEALCFSANSRQSTSMRP